MPKTTKGGFYAVNKGREPGVYLTWDDCEAQVKGFHGAKYKKFNQQDEAEAFAGLPIQSSPTRQPSPVAKISPTGSTRITRPYSRPEPISHDLPVISSVAQTSPSKQLEKVKAMPILSTAIISPSKDTKWIQRESSPDVEDESVWDVAYTDGACKGNGTPGSVAGIGVWWGRDNPRNLAERCPGPQTNNRAELIAIVRLLETAPQSKRPLLVKTDSRYSMDCFKKWLPNWIKTGFINSSRQPVKNAPLIRYLSALLDDRAHQGQKVRLQHIKGHAGHEGNEGADRLAGRGTGMPATEERDWESLERTLRAHEALRPPQEGGSVEISDLDSNMYAEGLVDNDELMKDLEFYADGLASDEDIMRELSEA